MDSDPITLKNQIHKLIKLKPGLSQQVLANSLKIKS